jgi:hypothetical protein
MVKTSGAAGRKMWMRKFFSGSEIVESLPVLNAKLQIGLSMFNSTIMYIPGQ